MQEKRLKRKGFTIVELLIAITLILFIVSLLVSSINWQDREASKVAGKLASDFSAIEVAFNNYLTEKNQYPQDTNSNNEILDESSFVPTYLFIPKVPNGFDQTYNNNLGYSLKVGTGSTYYICVKTATSVSANDVAYKAAAKLVEQAPIGKVVRSTTSCGATTDSNATGTIYITYWLVR